MSIESELAKRDRLLAAKSARIRELEAQLEERTCKCVAEYAESPIDGKTIVLHRCSVCHELMRPTMRYCPDCGARVTPKNSETTPKAVVE